MAAAKKNFKKDNPALSFVSVPGEEAKETAAETDTTETKAAAPIVALAERPTRKNTPPGYKPNPAYIEVKSKRVQLLMQPSIEKAITELAKEKGISKNEAIGEAIEDYLRANGYSL